MTTGRRILTDTDGNKYRFNCDSFSGEIQSKIRQSRSNEKSNGNRLTKVLIRNNLAEQLHMSPESVKKWESETGPSDIGLVKEIARYFEKDYHKLLVALEDNQEVETMTNLKNKPELSEYDIKLIEEVSSEVIKVLYQNISLLRNSIEYNEKISQPGSERKILETSLYNLGYIIDKSALFTSDSVRNKLHRIAIELYDFIIDNEIPTRWEDGITEWKTENGSCESIIDTRFLREFKNTRENFIWNNSSLYLYSEIELAEKYGFEDNKYPPDWYDNMDFGDQADPETGEVLTREDLFEYGFQGHCFQFCPIDIYANSAVEAIKAVLKYDFWGERHE